jgi:adenylate cyclase
MKAFIRQLRERHVVKVAIAYLAVAWMVLQLADVIFPAMQLPAWSIPLTLGLLTLGFPVAVVLSWMFDATAQGIQRTKAGDETVINDTADTSRAREFDRSIAVLPFPDLSAERDQEHFCDGLAEELLNVLSRVPGLRVPSRTSCFAFKNRSFELAAAAEKLRVAYILEGSVRKTGNRLRVTAQLIETATDSHLWSETYDREIDDIFSIQDDIASRILDKLKIELDARDLPDPTTKNAKAYEYYLRGRGYAVTRSRHGIDQAIVLFQKAAAIDSGFVRAWINLAEASAFKATFFDDTEASRHTAMEAGEKAMLLAPESAGGHMARGFGRLANRQYGDAEEDFRKAVELDPKQLEAYHYLGRAAHHQGARERALHYYGLATELNPDDFESPLIALAGYDGTRGSEAAVAFARIGVERAERHLEDYPDNPRAYYLGIGGLVLLGDMERARVWADRALALAPNDPSTRYNLACFYAITGEEERALDLLENSIQSRSWIEMDPELDSLRLNPRYRAIVDSLPE